MPDMRFAPPNPLRIADRASGLNAVSVRSYNERLVLSLLLQSKDITRLEIGERTGLSAQTVSVIVRSLEQEGLIAKGEAQRGRVGPPTVPISLNPEGAYSVGISVGHRQVEVVLVDFVGSIRSHTVLPFSAAQDTNHPQFMTAIAKAIADLPRHLHSRIAGIGLALPGDEAELELTPKAARERFDALQEEVEREIGYPVYVQNDITAAAGGESMFGVAKHLSDYLFFYLGARLHSRLVLNHQIYNTTAAVSFDVGILRLEQEIRKNGNSPSELWERRADWPSFGDAEIAWQRELLEQMKSSIAALKPFVPVASVVLSSYAPQAVCKAICRELEQAMPGISAIAGNIERSPKAVGAAGLPFSSRFMVE
ncbi:MULTISPECIES: ROK family transcriptional regulator [unclassified Mesorhizobium]|uniref:ROK family transcriptional regulator n=1 Tax=unclassified Mesorhizobium TaxID=325217 RepID=UPI001D024853|nr:MULTISPECIES: ROK family transcriptional regulator [unclassified Mesorhizobium]UCI27422.1 ROK family protein [Mesorhizobium sp. B2-8-5]